MEKTRNFTEGGVLKSLIRFAVPVLAALFLQSLYGGVDLLIVGQFAETADVSGVATGSLLMQTVTMVITGLAMGVTVYVGQKIGEKNQEEAGKAIGAGIVLFCLLDAVLAILLAVFAKNFASALHAPQEAYEQTCQYIMVCGIGIVFIGLYNLLGAVFRGIGDSKTPLLTVFIACICNIAGDLLFVAVIGLGAMGAALATVMAQAFSVLISLFFIRKKTLPFVFCKEYIRFDKRLILRELRLGTPIALQDLLVGISFLVIQTVVNSIDVFASAGVGVAEKVCGFIMLVPSAFSQAMSAFVAQNIGAGLKGRAVKALWYGIATSLCAAVMIGSFTFWKGNLLAAIFTKDAAVIMQAHAYLKAYAIDTLLTSILFCYIGYYNGCGNTFFVMLQGIVGAFCVRIPVVFFMSHLSNATLFHIGLATPVSSACQIMLCVLFMLYKNRKERT
ncbi:MAG: MATE family efflux transporter [Bacillus sp. (in: Bacteria)]|nr:MATE family efflux transporter [Bacillus sp. (in: firmicutes)]MCM1426414.1 MATE family efflux transporter [Eubacterium sp.]